MQTKNRSLRADSRAGLVEEPFDLEFFPADAVRFIPVHFHSNHRTIQQTHGGFPFLFSPLPSPVNALQSPVRTDRASDCNGFDVRNGTDDLEVHGRSPVGTRIHASRLLRMPEELAAGRLKGGVANLPAAPESRQPSPAPP